jgi:hypothetical protein
MAGARFIWAMFMSGLIQFAWFIDECIYFDGKACGTLHSEKVVAGCDGTVVGIRTP